jgi:hypothetical protein
MMMVLLVQSASEPVSRLGVSIGYVNLQRNESAKQPHQSDKR